MYKYQISVIMPVYNSALYIGEAIESIMSQTLGADNIQLIIVNDGSTDNSAEIIRAYKDKHPCITYIEKENGGVASARNEALKHVEGKYTAFLDPDDTVSADTYERVISFFEANYDKTNVVSYPIYFFGEREGAHPLNDKFDSENKVLDLMETGEFQLHITSSVIKSEIARKITFKHLATSEDAEALLRLLIDTPRLGIVNEARYNYRKHAISLINSAQSKREWYFEHLDGYFRSVITCATQKYNLIPRFIQNAIIYDLSWKINCKKRPLCLSEDEAQEFIKAICEITSELDDDVILEAKNLSNIQKYRLIEVKHREKFVARADDIVILDTDIALSKYPYTLEFAEQCGDKIKITVRIRTTTSTPEITQGIIYVGGSKISSNFVKSHTCTTALGIPVIMANDIELEIPISMLEQKTTVYFGMALGDTQIIASSIGFGKFFPMEQAYASSFACIAGILITHDENALIACKATPKLLKKCRRAFEREIWKSNGFAERKAVIARILSRIYKRLHKKPIWIISDRLSVAGDNGEALFDHLNKTKFKGAMYFFAIRRGADYDRLKKRGRVIDRASLKYKIIHLAADTIISSQAEDFVTNPFDYYGAPYKDILVQKPFVFLQHGVIKDDLSSWLDKYNKNIKGFVTSAKAEYDSILNTSGYNYTENELWLTGLPRFDALESEPQKIITVMPTWRRYFASSIDISNGKWKNNEGLADSEYVKFYNAFLNDENLARAVASNDCKILFVPHPNMTGICDFIDTPPYVTVLREFSYKEIYKISSLIVTDYSSCVFDMAYLDKPIVYAQFDRNEFFSGAHTYERGYFDYEKNGFGKVAYTLDEALDAVIQCIESSFAQPQIYHERVDEFFAYRDRGCCERVVKKLLTLGVKNDNSK